MNAPLLSYHNDVNVKNKYVERFKQHMLADQVIQGTGFANGRGCFIGCTFDAYQTERDDLLDILRNLKAA